ncbi:MAG: SAM-dependent methyltransferase [Bacteroidia bacterium]|jgi:SAM-dependent methyltransferase
MNTFLKQRSDCAVCGNTSVETVIELEQSPIANKFLNSADEPLELFPLNLQYCKQCNNLQLEHCISDDHLYDESYAYFTPTSNSLDTHYMKTQQEFSHLGVINNRCKMIEIGSNNGEFLRLFQGVAASILGIDPAKDAALIANATGVPTIADFFNLTVADKILSLHGQANLVVARHMFAHNVEPQKILAGVEKVLAPDGTFYIENAYAIDTLLSGEFDQIYHEHMYYYGASSLNELLKSQGFEIYDIFFSEIHGGTACFMAARKGVKPISARLKRCLDKENTIFSDTKTFPNFRFKVSKLQAKMAKLFKHAADNGETLGVYSIPNKFFTLMSHCDIPLEQLSMFIDTSPNKIGKFLPGALQPIEGEAALTEKTCDIFIVGAWNYSADIKAKSGQVFKKGTKLVFPLPEFEIYDVY